LGDKLSVQGKDGCERGTKSTRLKDGHEQDWRSSAGSIVGWPRRKRGPGETYQGSPGGLKKGCRRRDGGLDQVLLGDTALGPENLGSLGWWGGYGGGEGANGRRADISVDKRNKETPWASVYWLGKCKTYYGAMTQGEKRN